jgi:thioredoxin reductase (NADPH)
VDDVTRDVDVLIAGGGIAGSTAGLTAARLGHSTLVLTGDVLGGQLVSIEKVEGYPGFPDGVAGYDLCPMAQEQAENAGAEYSMTSVEKLEPVDGRQGPWPRAAPVGLRVRRWRATTGDGDILARAVIIATGSSLKKLDVPGEDRLRDKGVSHCASCDAPLLRGKVVAVAGGGDSAMQEALTLAEHVSKAFLFQRDAALSGQASYRERVAANGKIEVRLNASITEILGDDEVTGVRVVDTASGATEDIAVAAIFAYVGLAPNTAFLAGVLPLDASGLIPTDGSMRSTLKGVCAAGSVRLGSAGRAAGSAGDGAAAAVAIDRYLATGVWTDS